MAFSTSRESGTGSFVGEIDGALHRTEDSSSRVGTSTSTTLPQWIGAVIQGSRSLTVRILESLVQPRPPITADQLGNQNLSEAIELQAVPRSGDEARLDAAPTTGDAYAQSLHATALQALHAMSAEAAAELVASAVCWGAVKSYSEAWLGEALAQRYPDMDPYARGALQALAAGPFLAGSFFLGIAVLSPAVKSLLGAEVKPADPQRLVPDPPNGTPQALTQAKEMRERLVATQGAGRIGTPIGDLTAIATFGTAYGIRNLMGPSAATPWGSTVAAAAAGGAMMLAQSAIALASRTGEGQPTHGVSQPGGVTDVVGAALRNIMVATTPDGAKTESLTWQARNLVQEVAGVELLASVFGMTLANSYVTWLGSQGEPSSGAESFARGLGGVYCTVGVFFFATLSLGARRGHTDEFFSGTRGALQSMSPLNHSGSLEKLFKLDPEGAAARVANVVDGAHHLYRSLAALPAHLVLDAVNVLTKPWHPIPPVPTANLIDLG